MTTIKELAKEIQRIEGQAHSLSDKDWVTFYGDNEVIKVIESLLTDWVTDLIGEDENEYGYNIHGEELMRHRNGLRSELRQKIGIKTK